ncbi:hypothetical protein [Caulobacter sp. S45]|uniref:hypothetical protein n=1 Tax=Caulobacter sp. S45 TaxID=1641861 RepID=UPI0015763CE4|nr:hypothetical protein [Caulobacter sp. S45]
MSWPDAILHRRLDAAPAQAPPARAPAIDPRLTGWSTRVGGPVALGAAMLMAVTLLIGRPTVFTDTDDYFSQGKDVVKAATLWITQGRPPINPAEVDDRLHDPGDQDEEPVHNQNGARSVYYGLFVYACERIGTLWLLAAAQAALAAGIVYALWRVVAPGAQTRSYLVTMAVLAAGSSLPVFTGFAMPDLFAGFSVAATLLVTLYADRFGVWGKAVLWLLLAACVNFHGSNLLTSLGLAVLSLGWLAWRRAPWRVLAARGGMVLAAAMVAILASEAYAVAIKLRTGDELGRPPFLTARVLADGPGRAYLRHACALRPFGDGEKLTLCAVRNAPLADTEEILWSDDPAKGIFNSADYHARVRLEHEERGFVLHALAYDPLGEVSAAFRNWGTQLVTVGYDEPLRDPAYYLSDEYWKTTTLKPLLLRDKPCDPEVGACILHVPAVLMSEIDAGVALLALGWLGAMLGQEAVRSRRRPHLRPHPEPVEGRGRGAPGGSLVLRQAQDEATADRVEWRESTLRTRATVVLMVLAVALNAAVCGVLSGPFARYEARVLWLIPAAALLLHAARRPAAR